MRGNRRNNAADFGGTYVVFLKRAGQIVPANIRTGLTDLDYSEVLAGLKEGDSVLVLPSAGMIQSQQDMKERINRVTGGGGVPGMQQQTPTAPRTGAAAGGAAARPGGGGR